MQLKPIILFNNNVTNVDDTSTSEVINIEEPRTTNDNELLHVKTSCNTDLKISDIEKLEQSKTKFSKLQNKVHYFNLSEKSFDGHEDMLIYYTGLESFGFLNLILDHIKPDLTSKNQRLIKFQKLLLCLMKLRLNLPFKDIGFRFNITCSTASLIFRKAIYIRLEHLFKNLIYGPEREPLYSTMPQPFFSYIQKYYCFEIGIEKPSSLKARAQTWSSYKNKHAVKYLITKTPQGVISFISFYLKKSIFIIYIYFIYLYKVGVGEYLINTTLKTLIWKVRPKNSSGT